MGVFIGKGYMGKREMTVRGHTRSGCPQHAQRGRLDNSKARQPETSPNKGARISADLDAYEGVGWRPGPGGPPHSSATKTQEVFLPKSPRVQGIWASLERGNGVRDYTHSLVGPFLSVN